MASSSARNELFFLEFIIDELKGPSLPTNGDVLRYYFHLRRLKPREPARSVARVVVGKCIEIWSSNGIPTTRNWNGVKYLLNMLDKFKLAIGMYERLGVAQRRQALAVWRGKFEVVFSVATKDATKRCGSEASRRMLLAAQEKMRQFHRLTKNDRLLLEFAEVPKPKAKKSTDRPGPKSSKKRPTSTTNTDSALTISTDAASLVPIDEWDNAPLMLQRIVVKEEIDIDWDLRDNWTTCDDELSTANDLPLVDDFSLYVT